MKPVVIANPNAAARKVGRRWGRYHRAISNHFGSCSVRMTQRPGDATAAARQSLQEGAERLIVVGGDGTLNEVVNGLFAPAGGPILNADASIAFIPAGTGVDFARSVGAKRGRPEKILAESTERRIDLGRVTLRGPRDEEFVRHFINISSFGASAHIANKVNRTSKRLGGRASFYFGTLKGLMSWRNRPVHLRVDDIFETEVIVNSVAVANGRYFGGAMKVAPDALVDDGELDVVVMGAVGLRTFLQYSHRLYRGSHVNLVEVTVLRGKEVTATPLDRDPIPVETDGEYPGHLPVAYKTLPGAVKLLAPWDQAEATSHGPPASSRRPRPAAAQEGHP